MPPSSSGSEKPKQPSSRGTNPRRNVAVEQSLIVEAPQSLLWLRDCRAKTGATWQANLPIVVMTCSTFEAVLSRAMLEVIDRRRRRGAGDRERLGLLRDQIESGSVFTVGLVSAATELFSGPAYPQCAKFWTSEVPGRLHRLIELRHLAAHGGAVWVDFEKPPADSALLKFAHFRKDKHKHLAQELAQHGFSLQQGDVFALEKLFSDTPMIDALCRNAWSFFKQLGTALRADSEADHTGFYCSGIIWPDVAEALNGRFEPM